MRQITFLAYFSISMVTHIAWRVSLVSFNRFHVKSDGYNVTHCDCDGSMTSYTWWRHQMETFSALLALCHRWLPRTKASDAELWFFFDLHLNKRLSKQWGGWWFETPSRPWWRLCNETQRPHVYECSSTANMWQLKQPAANGATVGCETTGKYAI